MVYGIGTKQFVKESRKKIITTESLDVDVHIYNVYMYFYITVRLQQSAQREEQIIGIKNDSLVYNY